METIVLTGSAGLLGSHFSRHLLSKGYRVVGIDDLSGGYAEYLPDSDNFEFWPINLADREVSKSLDRIFSDNEVTACFHFAAYAAEGLSPFIRHFNYTNNILASSNVINACVNHDVKMIFTSSMAVYGNHQPPFTEKMLPVPVDPYGIAKYAVEMDIKQAHEQFGLRYSIIRPHNVVGIYQNIWDRYRNVVGIFIRRVLDGGPMLIFGDGEQTRAFSDIEYYMEPFEKLINDDHNSEIFNIGADKDWTINQLATIITNVARKHGYTATTKGVEARHEAKHAYCDHTKAKDPDKLDFKDRTVLEKLVDSMFRWALTQPKREQKSMEYEIQKGMYEYWR
jgi:UDP-glucose 4-epimerase